MKDQKVDKWDQNKTSETKLSSNKYIKMSFYTIVEWFFCI